MLDAVLLVVIWLVQKVGELSTEVAYLYIGLTFVILTILVDMIDKKR